MKLIRILTVFVLSLTLMVTPVLATAAALSPAREGSVQFHVTEETDGTKTVGCIYDENDAFERNILEEELIITTLWHLDNGEIEVHDEIEETLVAARDELKQDNWTDLVPGFEEAWAEATGGAPVENAVITDIFDVRYNSVVDGFLTKLLVEGKSATFDIKVDGITEDSLFVVGHKPSETEEWKIEDYKMNEDGTITISVDSLSPFFIAVDNNQAPATDDAPSSPQTGVNEFGGVFFAAGAVVVAALGFLCAKKFRKVADR